MSHRKAANVRELAARFAGGRISEERLRRLTDDELTAVPGIGLWTVHSALLISLQHVTLSTGDHASPTAHLQQPYLGQRQPRRRRALCRLHAAYGHSEELPDDLKSGRPPAVSARLAVSSPSPFDGSEAAML